MKSQLIPWRYTRHSPTEVEFAVEDRVEVTYQTLTSDSMSGVGTDAPFPKAKTLSLRCVSQPIMHQIAVIGVGAIAELTYLPAIKELPNANLSRVVDIEEKRARSVARAFDADGYATDVGSVLETVDAAIITTPPRFHAEIAKQCIQANCHVLTEKPVAMAAKELAELVSLSRTRSVHYAISRQLREAPASRLIHTFVNNGMLGDVHTFAAIYGDGTHWDFASEYRLNESLAWGGALTDKAPHILDVLLWWFGDDVVLERYADDGFDGLEANAELDLSFPQTGVRGTLEVTAARDIENTVSVVGERGEIRANPKKSVILFHEFETGDRTRVTVDEPNGPKTGIQRIGTQTQRFVESLDTDSVSYVPAETAVSLIGLIEDCYRSRELIDNPWERKHLTDVVGDS